MPTKDDSEHYNITITYRRTKRLTMRIGTQGDVRISAPIGYPRREIEQFIKEHTDWIKTAIQKTADRQTRRNAFFDQLPLNTPQQCHEATQRLDALIKPLVEKHAKQIGVKPSSIFYSASISKWGTCYTKTRRLQFSAYLLLLPTWCVEHVVVHELVHLIEPSHNQHFYQLMDKYFPRWREARQETRKLAKI